ncbi:MAG: hypothetical protein H6679_00750 [Epsilonproteobacteria bacterium]|nr:hypothetical protein [Campylobacterota bacterium]
MKVTVKLSLRTIIFLQLFCLGSAFAQLHTVQHKLLDRFDQLSTAHILSAQQRVSFESYKARLALLLDQTAKKYEQEKMLEQVLDAADMLDLGLQFLAIGQQQSQYALLKDGLSSCELASVWLKTVGLLVQLVEQLWHQPTLFEQGQLLDKAGTEINHVYLFALFNAALPAGLQGSWLDSVINTTSVRYAQVCALLLKPDTDYNALGKKVIDKVRELALWRAGKPVFVNLEGYQAVQKDILQIRSQVFFTDKQALSTMEAFFDLMLCKIGQLIQFIKEHQAFEAGKSKCGQDTDKLGLFVRHWLFVHNEKTSEVIALKLELQNLFNSYSMLTERFFQGKTAGTFKVDIITLLDQLIQLQSGCQHGSPYGFDTDRVRLVVEECAMILTEVAGKSDITYEIPFSRQADGGHWALDLAKMVVGSGGVANIAYMLDKPTHYQMLTGFTSTACKYAVGGYVLCKCVTPLLSYFA